MHGFAEDMEMLYFIALAINVMFVIGMAFLIKYFKTFSPTNRRMFGTLGLFVSVEIFFFLIFSMFIFYKIYI